MADERKQLVEGIVGDTRIQIIRTSQDMGNLLTNVDYEARIGNDTMIIDNPGLLVGDVKVSINGQPVKDQATANELRQAVFDASHFDNDGSHNMAVFGNKLAEMVGLSKLGAAFTPAMTAEEGHGLLDKFKAAKAVTERETSRD